MQIRLFKIIAILFLSFIGYSASANAFLHDNRQEKLKKTLFVKESVNKIPRSPFNYEFIINSIPVQFSNLQQGRTVHYAQFIYTAPNTYNIAVRYLNFICGRGNSELSWFRKLILFPFHAFW
ncbi:hypothetical protein MuYL_3173 [Mucilaginibacter xinganensis]|uniref:Uncharacterized protein n=1 Tax=Mucilaginibacter xinganensis TaxID=1234841 RepID=A0A223NZQ3_9SPHI|nr:hypothetical protein MuYL_3173 [Mucilaginibacter xinganensis]